MVIQATEHIHPIGPSLDTAEDATQFEHYLGRGHSVLVIMPDGYIAYMGKGGSDMDLLRWFQQWFISPMDTPDTI